MENYLISPNPSSLTELTPNQAAFVGGLLGTVLTVSLIIGVLLIIAGWKIFEKAGEKGWKILIPIYDIYIFFKICGLKNWFWAAFCITVIGSIMISANIPANAAERKSVITDGTRRAIIIPVTIGTISSHGVMVKRSCSEAVTSAICCVSLTSFINPAMVKMVSVIIIDGMVVISM